VPQQLPPHLSAHALRPTHSHSHESHHCRPMCSLRHLYSESPSGHLLCSQGHSPSRFVAITLTTPMAPLPQGPLLTALLSCIPAGPVWRRSCCARQMTSCTASPPLVAVSTQLVPGWSTTPPLQRGCSAHPRQARLCPPANTAAASGGHHWRCPSSCRPTPDHRFISWPMCSHSHESHRGCCRAIRSQSYTRPQSHRATI
jgi:hypothetical protein